MTLARPPLSLQRSLDITSGWEAKAQPSDGIQNCPQNTYENTYFQAWLEQQYQTKHMTLIQVLQQIVHCSWKTEKHSPEKGSEQY